MSSLCTSAIAALDDSLALLYESSGKLKAAKSVDIAEVIEQLKMAAESARTVRELVWSELPEASWQTREELDALIEKIQRILEARTLEQLRSRLLALATELERGTIVHRRAHRVNELKQLRDQAINELRSQAGLEGAPQTLPGPEAGQWIEWACSLQEPEDAESLQALRNGFAHLDDLVANLEPSMWVAADSPALETPPEPERSADRTQPKQSRLETNRFEEPVVSSGPNLAMKVGFDPKDKEVVARMATENTSLSQPQEVAASSEVPAVQSEVPVLADALAALDDSLGLLYESLEELKAAKSVDIAAVIEQLKMAAKSARTVRELVWSELPEASWQTREELDALIEKIQRILEARTLEQLRSRLLALATELERGTIVHRRAHRVNELKQLRDQAINELRSQAGLEGAPQTLPGPEAGQWIEWACSLQEPEDAESLQALRNGFAHLDDLVANLEPSMWVAADSPALETPPEPERSADRTQPKQSRLETNRFEEPVVSSGPNLAMKVGFDPKDKEVVARMATENTSLSQPQEVAASSEVPAVQSEVPVLADALAALDDSLGLLYESLEELKAAKSVDIAAVIEQLKMAAKSARTVRELVWSELPEASWQTREELDALIEKIQRILEARTLEQLRSRLLALATELERGTIVHRRAHRVDELKQLRDQAINELRSQGGLEGAPQTLPGPEAGQWIEWACGLQEPEDAESLQVLRNGFAHLDDFVANLEPSMWVAADSPKQSRLETNRFEEPVVLSGPKQIELDAAKSPGGRDEPRLPNPRDELSVPALASNTLTPNDVTPPRTEEEIQRIQEQERALLASMMGLASDPVGHFSRPVEPPFTAEVFREPRAAPAIAIRPVEPPFTTEAFREPSSAPASTKRPGEPHSTAETKAFRETSAAVAIAKCPVEPTFTAETETFRETNAATFSETT